MKIRSISFSTWRANHSQDHDAKWCRELYPWQAFARIDFGAAARNVPQEISVGHERFIATVTEEFVGDNGRPNFLIKLTTRHDSKREQWEYRHWDDVFQLVAAPDGQFITLFTKKKDPSKELLRRFLGGGLERIEEVRSLPVSGLLFQSLIAYAAEDIFGDLQEYAKTESSPRESVGPEHDSKRLHDLVNFEPFLSKGRDLWIMYSFTEEKAHRLALRVAGACRKAIIVYCQPTFTRHHRCQEKSVNVASLSEFLGMGSAALRNKYLPQARFLLNHLHLEAAPEFQNRLTDLRTRILSRREEARTILTSDLREAKSGLGIVIGTLGDAAYVLACANVLNAALNKKLGLYKGTLSLEKDVYSFKAQFCGALEQMVEFPVEGVEMYVAPDGLTYARVEGIQFTFHAIPKTPRLLAFARSVRNVPQEWSGLRLQPIASLVLAWARKVLLSEGPMST